MVDTFNRWIIWSSVCVSGIVLFIYFSGGENALGLLIFKLTLAYGEAGWQGKDATIQRTEQTVKPEDVKGQEKSFLGIRITNGLKDQHVK